MISLSHPERVRVVFGTGALAIPGLGRDDLTPSEMAEVSVCLTRALHDLVPSVPVVAPLVSASGAVR